MAEKEVKIKPTAEKVDCLVVLQRESAHRIVADMIILPPITKRYA
jgi:hypothetical protein